MSAAAAETGDVGEPGDCCGAGDAPAPGPGSVPGTTSIGRGRATRGPTTAPLVRFVLGVFGYVVPFVPSLPLAGFSLDGGEYAVATILGICLLQSSIVFLWLLGSIADRFQPYVAGWLMPGVLGQGGLAWLSRPISLGPDAEAADWIPCVLIAGTALAQLVVVAGALRAALRAGARATAPRATLAAVCATAAIGGAILWGIATADY